jgi:hypothetical protein
LIGHPVGLKITLQQAAGNALAVAVQAAFAVKYLFCGYSEVPAQYVRWLPHQDDSEGRAGK